MVLKFSKRNTTSGKAWEDSKIVFKRGGTEKVFNNFISFQQCSLSKDALELKKGNIYIIIVFLFI